MLAVYAAAACLGYLIGARGVPPFRPAAPSAAAAAARVGWAFAAPEVQASPEDWAALQADLTAVRDAWPAPLRKLFELMVALRGLSSGGRPDWVEAERLCHALKWSRCDREALEVMRARGRP